ncbi:PIN domain-containing protein [Kiritimatiellaeota bacterium B1221]|nr:PIN domain-containing protein [Kiritimatiellaeota bacterium B1221]
MKILVDTNVILDVLLNREPFVADSALVFDLVVLSRVEGYLCATTVTTLDYLLKNNLSRKEAVSCIRNLLDVFQVAPVNRLVLDNALESKITDFKDAVLEQSATVCGIDFIVTRNLKDFKKSVVPAVDPTQFLAML